MQVNIVYGVPGLTDSARQSIREALRRSGCEVLDDKKAREIKTGIDQIVDSYTGNVPLVLIISRYLEQKTPFNINDLLRYQKAVGNVELKIIVIVDNNEKGSDFLRQMSDNGMYLAVYGRETSPEVISELIVNGRKVLDAKKYYGVDHNQPVNQTLTVETAVAHMQPYLQKKPLKEKEILEQAKWVQGKLSSEDLLLAFLNRLPDDAKDILAENKSFAPFLEDYILLKGGTGIKKEASQKEKRGIFGFGRKNKAEKVAEVIEEIDEKARIAADEERERFELMRKEEQAKAEEERIRREAEAKVEEERIRREAEAKAEEERIRKEAEAKAEEERIRREAEAKAEEERIRREAESNAEKERIRKEVEAKLAEERARIDAEILEERERQEEEERQENERKALEAARRKEAETRERERRELEEELRRKKKEEAERKERERIAAAAAKAERERIAKEESSFLSPGEVKNVVKSAIRRTVIGVAGAQRHVGCTHQALLIAHTLCGMGFKVAIVEDYNQSDKVFDLIAEENGKEIGEVFTFSGVDYYPCFSLKQLPTLNAKNYNFVVVDFGLYDEDMYEEYGRCSLQVLVSGSRVWETRQLGKVFNSVDESQLMTYNFLFLGTPEAKKAKVKKDMLPLKNVFFGEYAPNPYSSEGYESILSVLSDFVVGEDTGRKKSGGLFGKLKGGF